MGRRSPRVTGSIHMAMRCCSSSPHVRISSRRHLRRRPRRHARPPPRHGRDARLMPVGTQGTVRTLSPADLKTVGAQLVLANTYHLPVRTGEGVVQRLGGLHRFMGWDRPLLTDSGGFQVFSLEGSRRVDEDGVEFQSHVDGSRRNLTPERATEIQWTLGADIAMAFDHVVPGGADEATARDALERTLRWLERCAARHRELADGRQTLWPILQGGTQLRLREVGLLRN